MTYLAKAVRLVNDRTQEWHSCLDYVSSPHLPATWLSEFCGYSEIECKIVLMHSRRALAFTRFSKSSVAQRETEVSLENLFFRCQIIRAGNVTKRTTEEPFTYHLQQGFHIPSEAYPFLWWSQRAAAPRRSASVASPHPVPLLRPRTQLSSSKSRMPQIRSH